ncbi:RNA polymerase subunit sigma-24 [Brevibacillus choshinensis]|uniref:RNA polymerase sigma factor n=1 Tax=Brevibacillus choshinensis TaxID=54911 RepID=A0ABR5N3S8_BRECH|nr:RNA polymerase sigma factor [Brevibacillus choshinensis]KQL45101.1 RNA polymerase subunit sigma-24 [Brevibacillus choshinensis]
MDAMILNRHEEQEDDDIADDILVERAKAGDREAFGELVRRHRAKVYGYARSYTQEPFMAEDIVQDALIRAFLHLGTLMDSRRFLPWLHRIVRNQAYTRMQKGPQKREQVFSGLRPNYRDQEPTDWEDLDSILHRLSSKWSQPADPNTNPEDVMVRRELLQTITGMLHCLNPRERRIVESHFFDHLSPMEIARLFQISQANVYQILSRSRKKLIQEKTRVVVDQYVQSRKEAGMMKTVVLNTPEALSLRTWVTCVMSLHGMLAATDRKMSFPMVMGLSGHAFRLTVVPEQIHISGPTMFEFDQVLQQGLRNLGFESRSVSEFKHCTDISINANHVDPALLDANAREKRQLSQLLPQALELIHRSIDRGYPVLAWDLFIPEFGLIYGYDDEKKLLHAGDNCGHSTTVPYDHLGRGLVEDLFVLALDEPLEIDQRQSLIGALQMAIAHYRGEGSFFGAINGLDAYSKWVDAFEKRTIEPNGNAYTLAIAQDARHNASAFLKEIAETWTDSVFEGIRSSSLQASDLYAKIADGYAQLCRLFPFPAGGEPNDPEQCQQAIALFTTIESQEQQAVALLENMLETLTA